MSDPRSPGSPPDAGAERLDGSSDDLDDTATTMRLRVLDLEGELWPEDQGRVDTEEEAGTTPGGQEPDKVD